MTTQPTNLTAFAEWLMPLLPLEPRLILRTLQAGHKETPDTFSGLPKDHESLTEALRGLAIAGKVVERKGQWHWLSKLVEKPVERTLFA